MDTLTTREKIERLEKELAELREQEKKEKAEAKKKANKDRVADFEALTKAVDAYNQKHDDSIVLAIKRRSSTGEYIISNVFPWLV